MKKIAILFLALCVMLVALLAGCETNEMNDIVVKSEVVNGIIYEEGSFHIRNWQKVEAPVDLIAYT